MNGSNNNKITPIMIGIGDMACSKDPSRSIKTMALGSCVAVVILDQRTKTAGMIHIALPDSTINAERAAIQPGYFADTGIAKLIANMDAMVCDPTHKSFVVKMAGGANVVDITQTFNIGKRNILAVKKILWQLGLGSIAEDVGGEVSRTVEVFVSNGMFKIHTPNGRSWEI